MGVHAVVQARQWARKEKKRKEKKRKEKKRKEKKRKETKRKEKKRKEKKRKEKKRKDYTFWRQFNEKPSIIPGCPGWMTVSYQQCGGAWLLLPFWLVHVHFCFLLPGCLGCQVIHVPLSICLPSACCYASGYSKASSWVLLYPVCHLHDGMVVLPKILSSWGGPVVLKPRLKSFGHLILALMLHPFVL